MTWQLALETEARDLARRLGVVPALHRVRALKNRILGRTGYEAHFDEALLSAIRPGDTVWDIGANVGLYSARFLERVGPNGSVVAFEPVAACVAAIETRFAAMSNLTVVAAAVGAKEGELPMELSDNPLSVDHHVGLRGTVGTHTTMVKVVSGDSVIRERNLTVPNVIKVDVEGFEPEVLEGMSALLSASELRGVFIEVHFSQLAERGMKQAPAELVRRLKSCGFRTRWVDASHLVGERRA